MIRPVLILATLAAVVASAVPASAKTTPAACPGEIVLAATNGTVPGWYSPGCYPRALGLLGPDLRDYSDVPSIIAAARRRDALLRLHLAVGRRAPGSRVSVVLRPPAGTIRVAVFAKKRGRFVVAAIGMLSGAGGTLHASLGKATRIRVSAGYVGSGDRPVTVSTTLKR